MIKPALQYQVMRLSLLVCLFTSKMPLYAQTEILNRQVKVKFAQISKHEALAQLAAQGQFDLAYNTRIVPSDAQVNLNATDWSVREVLYHILGSEYEFKTRSNSLIIKKSKHPQNELIGYLKDPATGQRIVGATIYDKKTLRATTTDQQGYYRLKVPESATVAIQSLAVCDTVLQVNSTTPRFLELNLQCVEIDTTPRQDLRLHLLRAEYRLQKFFTAQLNRWHDRNLTGDIYRVAQISLAPRVGTNHTLDQQVSNGISVNLTAGHSRAVRYVEVAGIGNFTEQRVQGFQVGMLFNINKGRTSGLQMAGLFSTANQKLIGAQCNGLLSLARTGSRGATQISGVASIIKEGSAACQVGGLYNDVERINGLQLSGFANLTQQANGTQIGGVFNLAQTVTGLQLGGVFSHAKTLRGVQINGIFSLASTGAAGSAQIATLGNITEQGHTSLQIGGLLNLADTLQGVQMAVLANHAKHARGIQIAAFNSANTCNCIQIGFINRVGRRWLPIINVGRKRG